MTTNNQIVFSSGPIKLSPSGLETPGGKEDITYIVIKRGAYYYPADDYLFYEPHQIKVQDGTTYELMTNILHQEHIPGLEIDKQGCLYSTEIDPALTVACYLMTRRLEELGLDLDTLIAQRQAVMDALNKQEEEKTSKGKDLPLWIYIDSQYKYVMAASSWFFLEDGRETPIRYVDTSTLPAQIIMGGKPVLLSSHPFESIQECIQEPEIAYGNRLFDKGYDIDGNTPCYSGYISPEEGWLTITKDEFEQAPDPQRWSVEYWEQMFMTHLGVGGGS